MKMRKFFNSKTKKTITHGIIILSLVIFFIDTIYKLVNNITYANKGSCLLYQYSSEEFFLFWENFVELWIIMVFGVVAAILLSKFFNKFSKFYPKNPITAFLYGSLLPVCSCAAIPIIVTLKEKLKFRTIITFIIAAPLLSPIIISLSFSVLGVQYTILRIICSFILAIGAGYVLEFFLKPKDEISIGALFSCNKNDNCETKAESVLDQSWEMIKKLFPYILIAGTISLLFSLFSDSYLKDVLELINTWYGKILIVLIGIPLYVCNGSDIFLLKPFVLHAATFPYGAALAFSLSASALCLPSIILLSKILGKRLTFILTTYVGIVCLLFAFLL
ncbi:MAG: permease [Bacilli bacterium]|nr:permease [Bacilli bacterium]MDD3304626.1 permease [Bacilli bacterium]MDD4053539.1 permease [Bacilli bacterium]MDD4411494.1 permease [Bacilli bacterium]